MNQTFEEAFPQFAQQVKRGEIEDLLPPMSAEEIATLEEHLKTQLPNSYKQFLGYLSGFTAFDDAVLLGDQHPFFHRFKRKEQLSAQQQQALAQRGGTWPPPSEGMLCFGEFMMEADGDQVLFDLSQMNADGECPVYYYAHEGNPPTVRKIADSFEQWLNEFGSYPEFKEED